MNLVSSAAMERVSDAVFRVARWRRQLRLIASDPLALEPLVEPHARQLGFAHVYVAGRTGETTQWLSSAVYAAEAARRDPIDICHHAIDRFHAFLETSDPAARDDFITVTRGLLETGQTVERGGQTCFVLPHGFQVDGYEVHAVPYRGRDAGAGTRRVQSIARSPRSSAWATGLAACRATSACWSSHHT